MKNEIIDLKQVSGTLEYELRMARWKARTDLGWLCRNILGFPDVCDESSYPAKSEDGPDEPIHQPLIDLLQKFPSPTPEQFETHDRIISGQWIYTPITPLLRLPGKRRTLILDFRGALKTTINIAAHTIQFIINYPDIAMMIVQSNSDKAVKFLSKIKKHFQGNARFRKLFPEHCPIRKPFEWGTQSEFTTEARSPSCMRSEPTCMAGSIEKGDSGIHVDVIKFSDIVEPSNITGNGINMVKENFYMMQNLLVGPQYWLDVEGTRYSFSDLYGEILEHELKLPPNKRMYKIMIRGVFKKDLPSEENHCAPENLNAPLLYDADGKRISLWPRRFPLSELEDQESRDQFTFATQQLNNPTAASAGGQPFPVENDEYERREITRKNFDEKVHIVYKEISVDFAYTIGQRSDSTAIVLAAWDSYNRCYVERIIHGKMLPDESLNQLFLMIRENLRHLKCVKIENTAYTHGIMTSLKRLMDTREIHVPVNLVPRDSTKSKEERILQTLQPYYKNKDLRFLADIPTEIKLELKKELGEFPSSAHDDILDAISDLFQDKEWMGRETPALMTPSEKQHYYSQQTREVMKRMGEIIFEGSDPTIEDSQWLDLSPRPQFFSDKTGAL